MVGIDLDILLMYQYHFDVLVLDNYEPKCIRPEEEEVKSASNNAGILEPLAMIKSGAQKATAKLTGSKATTVGVNHVLETVTTADFSTKKPEKKPEEIVEELSKASEDLMSLNSSKTASNGKWITTLLDHNQIMKLSLLPDGNKRQVAAFAGKSLEEFKEFSGKEQQKLKIKYEKSFPGGKLFSVHTRETFSHLRSLVDYPQYKIFRIIIQGSRDGAHLASALPTIIDQTVKGYPAGVSSTAGDRYYKFDALIFYKYEHGFFCVPVQIKNVQDIAHSASDKKYEHLPVFVTLFADGQEQQLNGLKNVEVVDLRRELTDADIANFEKNAYGITRDGGVFATRTNWEEFQKFIIRLNGVPEIYNPSTRKTISLSEAQSKVYTTFERENLLNPIVREDLVANELQKFGVKREAIQTNNSLFEKKWPI